MAGQRLKIWIKAVAGVSAVFVGMLVIGSVAATFLRSEITMLVSATGAPGEVGEAVDRLVRHLPGSGPDSGYRISARRDSPARPGQMSSPHCPDDLYDVEIPVVATRWQFSRAFAQLPALAADAGLRTCGWGYRTDTDPRDLLANLLLTGAAPVAVILGGVLWWRRERLPWTSQMAPGVAVKTGLVVGVGALLAAWAVAGLLVALGFAAPTGLSPDLVRQAAPAMVVIGVIVAPVVEEFAFRAWFLTHARQAIGTVAALLVSTAAFVAVHVPDTVPVTAGLALVGLVLGMLWLRTQSLLACVVAHATCNALWLAAALAFGSAEG